MENTPFPLRWQAEMALSISAAVAAGTVHSAAVECNCDFPYVVGCRLINIAECGPQRQRHIRARIPVRHREHIELVNDRAVELDGFHAAFEHAFECFSIYCVHLLTR